MLGQKMKNEMTEVEIAKKLLLGWHQCYKCGKWGPIGNDDDEVVYGHDPYDAEINDDYTNHWQCGLCLEISRDEI